MMLNLKFYQQPTEDVARGLLGKRFVRVLPSGQRLAGIITETEAYLGAEDPGAHTFGGRRTERVRSMYLGGGFVYVYFIYGVHYCINVVTGPAELGQAVLVRALEPTEGVAIMARHRQIKTAKPSATALTGGPGKLCQALKIDRALDGASLLGPILSIEDTGTKITPDQIKTTARIGLGCKHEAAQWPLRFVLKGLAPSLKPRQGP